jgi:hypothetical protein
MFRSRFVKLKNLYEGDKVDLHLITTPTEQDWRFCQLSHYLSLETERMRNKSRNLSRKNSAQDNMVERT